MTPLVYSAARVFGLEARYTQTYLWDQNECTAGTAGRPVARCGSGRRGKTATNGALSGPLVAVSLINRDWYLETCQGD